MKNHAQNVCTILQTYHNLSVTRDARGPHPRKPRPQRRKKLSRRPTIAGEADDDMQKTHHRCRVALSIVELIHHPRMTAAMAARNTGR